MTRSVNSFERIDIMSDNQMKWNKLWDLYGSGELAENDYNTFILCDYESGVNGELSLVVNPAATSSVIAALILSTLGPI